MLELLKNKLSQIHKQSHEARELLRFIGPGILVTVGFIDPATGRLIWRLVLITVTPCCG